jgi:hypothetical protein
MGQLWLSRMMTGDYPKAKVEEELVAIVRKKFVGYLGTSGVS